MKEVATPPLVQLGACPRRTALAARHAALKSVAAGHGGEWSKGGAAAHGGSLNPASAPRDRGGGSSRNLATRLVDPGASDGSDVARLCK